MPSNYIPFYVLNTLAILIELVFDMSKFIIINTVVLSVVIYEAIKSINWAEVQEIGNTYRDKIGSLFVYDGAIDG